MTAEEKGRRKRISIREQENIWEEEIKRGLREKSR